MSYWFERPHTLVLARSRIDLRNPRERDRLRLLNRKPLPLSTLHAHAFGRKS
jgi:hypothetical protein